PGRVAVQVLEWGTPFEGWMAPWVLLQRDGVALPYGGASVKRGDPARSEYLRIPAGGRREVTIDLAGVYDLAQPGIYRLEARILLHDVHAGSGPRTRAQHQPQALACPPIDFTLPG
ncbi:MAG: hypothetical protein ABIX46_09110, partial [Burkholderiaceae bacterium]